MQQLMQLQPVMPDAFFNVLEKLENYTVHDVSIIILANLDLCNDQLYTGKIATNT
jgi:hypothetical protein